jgi:hypothetical protein
MPKIHKIKHAVERIFNVVSRIIFDANNGFRVLIILFNFLYNRNGIASSPNKSAAGRNGMNSFFEIRGLIFGFYGKLGKGTFSY